MSDVYEWRTFEVGERVLTRNRPECFYCRDAAHYDAGLHGTVTEVEPLDTDAIGEPGAGAHRIWVAFDEDVPDGLGEAPFAAAELEPIS